MKKRMRKKVLAVLLALALTFSQLCLVPASASAAVLEETAAVKAAADSSEEEQEADVTETDTEPDTQEMPTAQEETEVAEEEVTEASATEPMKETETAEAASSEEASPESAEKSEAVTEEASEETEEEVEKDAYEAGYTTKKHLLSDGSNSVNEDGTAIYSSIEDESLTVASIQKKGGNYAKCTPEAKKKGELKRDPYYKLTFENSIGNFLSGGFKDNKGQHHGASHFVEHCYRQKQVYSQVYSYTKQDDVKKTIDYYYFIYVWWEDTDNDYHKASSEDVMTYCVEYGASISQSDPAYVKQKKTYDSLSEKQKKKISLAVYYGPHRDAAGNYYTSMGTKTATTKGYDPSTWTKTFWKRYVAAQLYIWSVQSGSFSEADARATADLIDSKYAVQSGNDAHSCAEFLDSLITYVETAEKLPSLAAAATDTQAKKKPLVLKKQADGTYKGVYQDANGLLNDGDWVFEEDSGITISPSKDGKTLTITSTKQIAKNTPALLTYTKKLSIPDVQGAIWYTSGTSQNMYDCVTSETKAEGFVAVYADVVETNPIQLHKTSAADPNKPVKGARFAILTEHAKAAVYNPATGQAMIKPGTLNEELKAEECLAGIKTWHEGDGEKVYPYSEELYNQLYEQSGGKCCKLYKVAYYGGFFSGMALNYVIETDENGDAATGELLAEYTASSGAKVYCHYDIIEISAPEGYQLPYDVTSANGGYYGTVFQYVNMADYQDSIPWLSVTNAEKPGNLNLYKYDSETAEALKDVVFHVYRDSACTDLYAQIVTDETGTAALTNMPPGTYYIKEMSGQIGYEVYGGVDMVVIEADKTTQKDMSNRPWVVSISVEKKLDEESVPEGQDAGKYSLVGAEYGVYAGNNISGANGKILYGKDAQIATLTTDEDGKASMDDVWARKNLRLGTYYVKELKAPEGFLLDDTVYEIDATNPADVAEADENTDVDEYAVDTVLHRNVVVKESLRTTPIKIIKKKQVKHSELPAVAEGAVFSVYDLDAMKVANITVEDVAKFAFALPEYDQYRVVINANPDIKYTVTTDAEGRAETTALMDGNYAVVEVKAPEGYALADSQTAKLPDEAGKEIVLEFYDRLLLGRIEVVKLGDSISGYEAIETKYGTWNRLTYEKKPLAGVEFTIYDEIGAATTITTNGQGYAQSEELPAGKYKVKETKTPAGLIIDDTVYEVEIKAEDTQVINPKLEVTNDVMTAELAVYKVGETILPNENDTFGFGRKPLEDVVFGVYNSEDLMDNQGNVILSAGSCVGIAKTDEEGQALLKECLVPGNYYYQEIQALEGYVLDTEQHPFTLRLGTNAATERMELNKESPLLNQYYKARIELVKVDKDNGKIKLADAVFGLYNADTNEKYGEYTTDADGRISIEEMPYGKWYFKELEAPDGYILEYVIYEFEVTEEDAGSVIQITAANKSTPKLGLEDYVSHAFPIVLIMGISFIAAGIYFSIRKRKCERKAQ